MYQLIIEHGWHGHAGHAAAAAAAMPAMPRRQQYDRRCTSTDSKIDIPTLIYRPTVRRRHTTLGHNTSGSTATGWIEVIGRRRHRHHCPPSILSLRHYHYHYNNNICTKICTKMPTMYATRHTPHDTRAGARACARKRHKSIVNGICTKILADSSASSRLPPPRHKMYNVRLCT